MYAFNKYLFIFIYDLKVQCRTVSQNTLAANQQ